DCLEYAELFSIDGDYYPDTGVMVFYGSASPAEWEAALQSITYRNMSTDPTTVTRTITFQVDDGFAFNHRSNAISRDVTIAPVNDPPALTVPGAGPSGKQRTDIAVTGVSAADVDAHGGVEALTLSVSHGTIRFVSLDGLSIDSGANDGPTITVSGTLTALNAALAGANLLYCSDAAFTGDDTLNLQLSDNRHTRPTRTPPAPHP